MKTESVIDFPKDTLCPDVWEKVVAADGMGEVWQLKHEVKDKVLKAWKQACPNAKVIHITGSITSNSYTENADIDVHFLDANVTFNDNMQLEQFQKEVRDNYQKTYVGKHPIEVYYQDNKFQDFMSVGCYDVLNDQWLVGPELSDQSFNPYSEYYKEVLTQSESLAKQIRNMIFSIYEIAVVMKKNIGTDFQQNVRQILMSRLEEVQKLHDNIRQMRKVYSSPATAEEALRWRNSRKWKVADASFKLFDKYGYMAILKQFIQDAELMASTNDVDAEVIEDILSTVKNYINNADKLAEKEIYEDSSEDEEGIANNDIYLSNMSKSFGDKAWFLKYLPKDIDTLVDLGGGAGEFAEYCKAKLGRDIKFIIIDNNMTFLSAAKKKGFAGFASLESLMKATDIFNPAKSCLVLSSVIHEIYSYRDPFFDDIGTFWTDVKKCNFKMIAIRDMSVGGNAYANAPKDAILWVYENVFKSEHLKFKGISMKQIVDSFEDNWGAICDVNSKKVDIHRLVHFLIKYRYQENWKREVKEDYLPVSQDKLQYWIKSYCGYNLIHKESSKISFYKKTWTKDFKLNIPDNNGYRKEFLNWLSQLNTHIKWLGEKSVHEAEQLEEGTMSNMLIASLLAISGILPQEALAKHLSAIPKNQLHMTSKPVQIAIDKSTMDTTIIGKFSYRNSVNILQWVHYTEAANQDLEGRKAIMSVVWNRAGGKPENLIDVVLKNSISKKGKRIWQFSEWQPGNPWKLVAPSSDKDWTYKVPKDITNPKVQKIWKEGERFAKQMLEGKWKSNIGKCNLIASDKDSDVAKSTWGKDCNYKIGDHRFGYDPSQDGFKKSGKTYVVTKGDTGYQIAANSGMQFSKLKQLNPDVDWNKLQIGQKLKLA